MQTFFPTSIEHKPSHNRHFFESFLGGLKVRTEVYVLKGTAFHDMSLKIDFTFRKKKKGTKKLWQGDMSTF